MHRWLLAASAAGGLLLSGATVLAQSTTPTPPTPPPTANSATNAGNVPNSTVDKAGAALHDVAQIQRSYSQRLQTASSDDQRRSLAQQANNESVQAVQRHGLSVDQYNQVIRLAQADPGVKERMLHAAQTSQ